jgi:hypothetical protein
MPAGTIALTADRQSELAVLFPKFYGAKLPRYRFDTIDLSRDPE